MLAVPSVHDNFSNIYFIFYICLNDHDSWEKLVFFLFQSGCQQPLWVAIFYSIWYAELSFVKRYTFTAYPHISDSFRTVHIIIFKYPTIIFWHKWSISDFKMAAGSNFGWPYLILNGMLDSILLRDLLYTSHTYIPDSFMTVHIIVFKYLTIILDINGHFQISKWPPAAILGGHI